MNQQLSLQLQQQQDLLAANTEQFAQATTSHEQQLQQLQHSAQHHALFQQAQQMAKHAKLSTLPHLTYLQTLHRDQSTHS